MQILTWAHLSICQPKFEKNSEVRRGRSQQERGPLGTPNQRSEAETGVCGWRCSRELQAEHWGLRPTTECSGTHFFALFPWPLKIKMADTKPSIIANG